MRYKMSSSTDPEFYQSNAPILPAIRELGSSTDVARSEVVREVVLSIRTPISINPSTYLPNGDSEKNTNLQLR